MMTGLVRTPVSQKCTILPVAPGYGDPSNPAVIGRRVVAFARRDPSTKVGHLRGTMEKIYALSSVAGPASKTRDGFGRVGGRPRPFEACAGGDGGVCFVVGGGEKGVENEVMACFKFVCGISHVYCPFGAAHVTLRGLPNNKCFFTRAET